MRKRPLPRRKLLQDMTVALVRSVSDKMKGFSRKETMEYYKAIMEKAWAASGGRRHARSQEREIRREP